MNKTCYLGQFKREFKTRANELICRGNNNSGQG